MADESKPEIDWTKAEVVKTQLKQNGYNLQYASSKLRGNDKIVLKAVAHSGCALQFADLTGVLCGNRKIALTAVEQDGLALEYVPSELRRDREVRFLASREKTFLSFCSTMPFVNKLSCFKSPSTHWYFSHYCIL